MCLKTSTILLQYTLHQFQYLITTCLCTVEIYQQMFQSIILTGFVFNLPLIKILIFVIPGSPAPPCRNL